MEDKSYIFRRIDDPVTSHTEELEALGSGIVCIHHIGEAYLLIRTAIDRRPCIMDNQWYFLHAFDHICTAYDVLSDVVTDWESGRDTFKSMIRINTDGFGAESLRLYLEHEILFQIETFRYGWVDKAALAYIIDLLAIYFWTYNDTNYMPKHLDFPIDWVANSKLMHLIQHADDVFKTYDPRVENTNIKTKSTES